VLVAGTWGSVAGGGEGCDCGSSTISGAGSVLAGWGLGFGLRLVVWPMALPAMTIAAAAMQAATRFFMAAFYAIVPLC